MLKRSVWVGLGFALLGLPSEASVRARCALALEVLQVELPASRDFMQRRLLLAQLAAPIVILDSQMGTSQPNLHAPAEILAWAQRLDELYSHLEKTFSEKFRPTARAIYEGKQYVHFSGDIGGKQVAEFKMGTTNAAGGYEAEPEIWINVALRDTQLLRRMNLMSYALRFAVRAAESQEKGKIAVRAGTTTHRFLERFILAFEKGLYNQVPSIWIRHDILAHIRTPAAQQIFWTDFLSHTQAPLEAQMRWLMPFSEPEWLAEQEKFLSWLSKRMQGERTLTLTGN